MSTAPATGPAADRGERGLPRHLVPARAARVPQDPPVCFELHREDEAHTTALLREGQVMAAVTSSPEPVAGCTVRRLGRMRYLPVAAPDFAARHLTGELEPRTCGEAPTIVFDRKDDLQDAFVRGLGDAAAARARCATHADVGGVRDAVVAGLGWGLAPEAQAAPLLRTRDAGPARAAAGRWTYRCTGSSGNSTSPRSPPWPRPSRRRPPRPWTRGEVAEPRPGRLWLSSRQEAGPGPASFSRKLITWAARPSAADSGRAPTPTAGSCRPMPPDQR